MKSLTYKEFKETYEDAPPERFLMTAMKYISADLKRITKAGIYKSRLSLKIL